MIEGLSMRWLLVHPFMRQGQFGWVSRAGTKSRSPAYLRKVVDVFK